jgi:hypothetical protein
MLSSPSPRLFAYDPEAFAGLDRQVDAVERVNSCGAEPDIGPQIVDL